MSRFYASIQGNRGEATRQGTEESGIVGHIRGWDAGIRVHGYVNGEGEDEFDVWVTFGSNASGSSIYIGKVRMEEGRRIWEPKC